MPEPTYLAPLSPPASPRAPRPVANHFIRFARVIATLLFVCLTPLAQAQTQQNNPSTLTISAFDDGVQAGYIVQRFVQQGGARPKLKVRYAISGTATNGLDYRRLTGKITMPANVDQVVISLIPFRDNLVEGGESATVTLLSGSNYALGELTEATVFIYDNAEITQLAAFDYLVIRYNWTSANGRDLDTRTAIVAPSFDGAGQDVGYARGFTIDNPATNRRYAIWGTDNRGDGEEAVLVDFRTISNDFPAGTSVRVRLRAFWFAGSFSIGGDARVNLTFTTYRGGEMVQSGFDFVNIGGEVVDNVSQPRSLTTDSVGTGVFDGEEQGFVTYQIGSGTGSIEAPGTRALFVRPPHLHRQEKSPSSADPAPSVGASSLSR